VMDLDKLHVCFNQSTDHTSRSIDLFIDNNNKAVTDRRLRPRCCHLGSYCKRPKNSKSVIVSCTFSSFTVRWPSAHVHEAITFLLVTLPSIHRLKKMTRRLRNIPFLIWLLTTPPHLKVVATLPCNLSLMACYADINVSQGSVATYARWGGIFDIRLSVNYPRNLRVKTFFKSVKN